MGDKGVASNEATPIEKGHLGINLSEDHSSSSRKTAARVVPSSSSSRNHRFPSVLTYISLKRSQRIKNSACYDLEKTVRPNLFNTDSSVPPSNYFSFQDFLFFSPNSLALIGGGRGVGGPPVLSGGIRRKMSFSCQRSR